MNEENIILEDQNVKITNMRAIIDGKTYSISNITSVEARTEAPSGCMPGLAVLLGVVFIIFLANDVGKNIVGFIFGFILIGSGIVMAVKAKPSHIVSLTSASGEAKALTSLDKEYIKKIVDALNTAIIQKG